jgi:hypothetical protein
LQQSANLGANPFHAAFIVSGLFADFHHTVTLPCRIAKVTRSPKEAAPLRRAQQVTQARDAAETHKNLAAAKSATPSQHFRSSDARLLGTVRRLALSHPAEIASHFQLTHNRRIGNLGILGE